MSGKLTSVARAAAYSFVFVALTTLTVLPTGTRNISSAKPFYCACCADEGDWYQTSERIDSGKRQEIERFKYSEATYASRDAEGDAFLDGKFVLSKSTDSRSWQLRLSGGPGKTGTMSLPIPLRLVSFGADVHDGKLGGGGGPLLYKEWRFDGPVTGTGVFKSWQSRGAKFHLILQGRGNHCTQAEDFTHWILYVNRVPVSLSLYGSLSE
jgi:hypothetical protein